jgi:type IV secretory pathway VirB2 component (pilin)
MTTAFAATDPDRSPFTGADVCRAAGLALPDGAARPVFEDDLWDFTEVLGLPVQMSRHARRFDFSAIANSRWRMLAKELVLAMLAPRHEAVAVLGRAYRNPVHLATAFLRLGELVRLLNWLTDRGIASLADIDADCCAAYVEHRRYVRDANGVVVGERGSATRRSAAQILVDLVNYRELFTIDRLPAGLRPWAGASASAIAEMPSGRTINKTAPVAEEVLRPMLAAATYLVTSCGPHAVELNRQMHNIDQGRLRTAPQEVPAEEFNALLADHERSGQPLPLLPDHYIRRRLEAGWSPDDPLTPIAWNQLARQAGFTQFRHQWLAHLRERAATTVRLVGAEKPFARHAATVDHAGGDGALPWSLPLHQLQATALVGIVRTAAIILIAAVCGMRASELMELKLGCRRPPEHVGPGLVRYRLASTVVKGQPLGGAPEEWVVIEAAYRAVELAERLHADPQEDASLFGRLAFGIRYQWFRNWVNGPDGQRLGLDPIPQPPVNLRSLRRTLALELAYRPGGVLATKIHLKHIAVATTEGYASRPGGAQAELLAEVNKHEADRNLELLWAEFRNYQQGVMPAGPGARELTEFFAHIDGKLDAADAGPPKVQRNNREMLNLLTKRARTLHLGTANYCWFTDPSRALCLKLAGTPNADRPLAGMCDSARCPQATHHPCHRPVWAEHAQQTTTFLGDLAPTRKAEHARLRADLDRAQHVLDAIDNADTRTEKKE